MSAATHQILMLGKGWFPTELGGLDRYFRELLEQLPEARGVVIGPAEDPPPEVRVVSKHSASLPVRLLAFTHTARRAARSADLIDAHFALYAFLPLLSGVMRRKPLLVHFQGPWADENVTAGDASRWRHYARRQLEGAVYRRADLVVTLTGAFRRLLVERYGVAPWNTVVLAPGVDLSRFSEGDRSAARARFGLTPDSFVICCVRRLVPRMGLAVLVDAWLKVHAEDPDARLLIAGDGELREELQRQIEARSLDASVTLLGSVSEDDLLALYRAADVNVVPSVSFEGFGLVVLEAAACGTPSIVTRAGGLPEAITGLGEDLAVPPNDAPSLAERLMRAQQGALPSRQPTRAWAQAHSWEQVADAHRELFKRINSGEEGASQKLRVVYLDHVARLSGAELSLLRLLGVLEGVEPHVILAEDGPLVDRLLQAGVSVEVLPMPGRTRELDRGEVRPGRLPLRAGWDTLAYSTKLARRLRQVHPDLVHTNSLKAGIYGSIAARLAGIPVVWYLHDRIDGDYLPGPAVRLLRALTRHLPDLVITNSHGTRETIGARTRAVVVPPVSGFAPAVASSPAPGPPHSNGAILVGMVGRLVPWKGQDVFLRAFAEAFPGGEQRALIVGAALFGEDEMAYGQELRRLAEELRLASRVEFRGHREDVATELQSMDVLVHASITPEPFGQVVVEGMSARLPVVASRCGGPEEIISDGIDGLLYPPGDVSALARILARLYAEPQLRTRLGRAAERRARDFRPEAVAEQMLGGYELVRRRALRAK